MGSSDFPHYLTLEKKTRILSIDPGVRHIVWSMWEVGYGKVEYVAQGVDNLPRPNSYPSVLDRAVAMSQMDWPSLAENGWSSSADIVVVEGQNCRNPKTKKSDILALSLVAGALVARFTGRALLAPTDNDKPRRLRAAWSSVSKEMRHNRLLNHYLPDLDLSREFLGKPSQRVYGDLLDTVAMMYWVAVGCPRKGL